MVQWGEADVWKVGIKVFALGRFVNESAFHVTFKCSPMSYDLLKDQQGLQPAPYLASRGMKWIQRTTNDFMDDETLLAYLKESHRLASLNLTKAEQKRLGLNQAK